MQGVIVSVLNAMWGRWETTTAWNVLPKFNFE